MYFYPDKDDSLTMMLIQSVSQGNYWGESEDLVLKTAPLPIGKSAVFDAKRYFIKTAHFLF